MSARIDRGDTGASLVLAVILLFAVGLVLVAVAGLATSGILNTTNLRASRTAGMDAENAVTIAMRYERSIFDTSLTAATPATCLPPSLALPSSDPRGTASAAVAVYCELSTTTAGRQITFFACPSAGVTSTQCVTRSTNDLYLTAVVAYADSTFAGTKACSATSSATCGADMVIQSWDVVRADG